MKEATIGAAEFKAKCLGLIDEVAKDHKSLVITKRGKPLARLVPIEDWTSMRGDWRGKVKILGDIVNFDTSDDWEALK